MATEAVYNFTCVSVDPEGPAINVEAEDWETAVQLYQIHPNHVRPIGHERRVPGSNELAVFATIRWTCEDGEQGESLSRAFFRAIPRRGGVMAKGGIEPLASFAERIGWEGKPAELFAKWDGQESWDEAEVRTARERAKK